MTIQSELAQLRIESESISASTDDLHRLAKEVVANCKGQVDSLDASSETVTQLTTSLNESTSQAASVTTAAEQLASAANEMSATIEQVSASATLFTSSLNETASAIEQNAASVRTVAEK